MVSTLDRESSIGLLEEDTLENSVMESGMAEVSCIFLMAHQLKDSGLMAN
jgi:hypothetical protein